MQAKINFKLTKDQFKEAGKYWLDLSKLTFASLILKLFEPGQTFVLSSIITVLFGLTFSIALVILGLRFLKEGNQYGHPHQGTLALLQNLGINIYRTDLNGTILIETKGTDYQVSIEKESIRAPPIVKSETKTSESQEYKYAASKNSDVFHYLSCSYVSSIKSDNLILFKTREEAIASGRRPCKKCKP